MRRPLFEVRAVDRSRIEIEDGKRGKMQLHLSEDCESPRGARESDVSTKQCATVREDTAPSVKTTSDRNGYPPLPHRLFVLRPRRPSDALP